MRRSTAILVIFGLLLALPLVVEAQDPPKIGYINSQRVIEEAPGAQEVRQELEQDLSRYRDEVQQMGAELQELIREFEQQRLTLSEQARQSREEEIAQRQQEYQERVQQLEQQAVQRQQELVQPIMNRINTVIEQIRREGSYTLIFDLAGQSILAADPGLDLTSEVIRRLRAEDQNASNGSGGP